jgi:hypothetical protein
MGILDNLTPDQPSIAVRTANQLKQNVRQTFNAMTAAFNNGAHLFWANPKATPAELAAALGTDAREVFELHGKLGQLIASVKPEAVALGMAVVGQFEYNEDGSLNIISTPPAE